MYCIFCQYLNFTKNLHQRFHNFFGACHAVIITNKCKKKEKKNRQINAGFFLFLKGLN